MSAQDSDLVALNFFKKDALERMADDERVIVALGERIEQLEFHLGKLRDLLWLGYSNTAGVLPIELVADPKAPKRGKK